jgi:hypothetical protein
LIAVVLDRVFENRTFAASAVTAGLLQRAPSLVEPQVHANNVEYEVQKAVLFPGADRCPKWSPGELRRSGPIFFTGHDFIYNRGAVARRLADFIRPSEQIDGLQHTM